MSVGVCLIVGNSVHGKETYLKLKTPEGRHPFSLINRIELYFLRHVPRHTFVFAAGL